MVRSEAASVLREVDIHCTSRPVSDHFWHLPTLILFHKTTIT